MSAIEDVVKITDAAKRSKMRRGRALKLAKAANLALDWSLPGSKNRDWRVRWTDWERFLMNRKGDATKVAKAEQDPRVVKRKQASLDPDVTC